MKSGGVRRVLGEVLGSALMLVVLCAGWVVAPSASAQGAAPAQKVFRYAFPVAETGFDPVQISDLYSATIIANIIESPLTYDYLARPVKLKLQTAAAIVALTSCNVFVPAAAVTVPVHVVAIFGTGAFTMPAG